MRWLRVSVAFRAVFKDWGTFDNFVTLRCSGSRGSLRALALLAGFFRFNRFQKSISGIGFSLRLRRRRRIASIRARGLTSRGAARGRVHPIEISQSELLASSLACSWETSSSRSRRGGSELLLLLELLLSRCRERLGRSMRPNSSHELPDRRRSVRRLSFEVCSREPSRCVSGLRLR